MPIERINYWGNPHIGIYMFTNDRITIVPTNIEEKIVPIIANVLKTRIVKTTIGGMNIIGVLVVGNNKGILLPRFIRDDELRTIKEVFDGNIEIVKSRYTALGNICLVNDNAALLHPDTFEELKGIVKDVLEVDTVEKGTIAGISTVGSAAYVTNKGGLVHPDANDAEINFLSNLFGVRFDIATVNFGIGFIKSGLVANTHGVLVGDKTTGPEILRISQILGDE